MKKKPKPKDPTIRAPRRFQGGIAEEAYRAGYEEGYEDKALQTIEFGLALESMFDIVKNGVDGFDPAGVAQRVGEKVSRIAKTTDISERLRRMEKENKG